MSGVGAEPKSRYKYAIGQALAACKVSPLVWRDLLQKFQDSMSPTAYIDFLARHDLARAPKGGQLNPDKRKLVLAVKEAVDLSGDGSDSSDNVAEHLQVALSQLKKTKYDLEVALREKDEIQAEYDETRIELDQTNNILAARENEVQELQEGCTRAKRALAHGFMDFVNTLTAWVSHGDLVNLVHQWVKQETVHEMREYSAVSEYLCIQTPSFKHFLRSLDECNKHKLAPEGE